MHILQLAGVSVLACEPDKSHGSLFLSSGLVSHQCLVMCHWAFPASHCPAPVALN